MAPISSSYRGYDIYELPPNTQGVTALQMLNILEGFDLRATRFGTAETLHLMIEAKKLAFEDRARLYGDPTFAEAPVKRLLSKQYAAKQRKQIDPYLAARRYDLTSAVLGAGDTTYLCVADSEGNMISLIQSNFRGMGSGVVVPGWDSFSITAANCSHWGPAIQTSMRLESGRFTRLSPGSFCDVAPRGWHLE